MDKAVTVQQVYDLSYRVAHDYFSDILNSQLIIFSVIVATMVGLQFYWSYRVSKNKIKEEVEKGIKEVEARLLAEYEKRVGMLVKIGASSEKKLSNNIKAIQADIYRTMGHFFDSEQQYSVSFIWWVRAAENYSLVGEDNLTRTALKWAKEAVEKVNHPLEIEDSMGEYQKILSSLDDSHYRLEKELLDEVVKGVLHKKLSSEGK